MKKEETITYKVKRDVLCCDNCGKMINDVFDKTWLKGISAQGYTTERNKHKVLDPDLLFDIEEAMFRALRTEITELLEGIKGEEKEIRKYWPLHGGVIEEGHDYNKAIKEFNQRIEEAKE